MNVKEKVYNFITLTCKALQICLVIIGEHPLTQWMFSKKAELRGICDTELCKVRRERPKSNTLNLHESLVFKGDVLVTF